MQGGFAGFVLKRETCMSLLVLILIGKAQKAASELWDLLNLWLWGERWLPE